MVKNLELSGAKVYPRGNAQIKLNEHRGIDVSQLIRATDGVIIETNDEEKFELFIEPKKISDDLIFGVTLNVLDKFKRVKSVAQWSFYTDPESKNGVLAVNSLLEGKEILVQGFKDGKEVISYRIENNPNSLEKNWWPVVVVIALVVLDKVDYKKETNVITHPDGSQTTEVTTTKSIGGAGRIMNPNSQDPSKAVDFDKIYFTSSRLYNTKHYEKLDGPNSEVIFLGNFKNLVLKSISNE